MLASFLFSFHYRSTACVMVSLTRYFLFRITIYLRRVNVVFVFFQERQMLD